jgi:hypothetical protein
VATYARRIFTNTAIWTALDWVQFTHNRKNGRVLAPYSIGYVNVGLAFDMTDANSDIRSALIEKCSPF